MHVVESGTKAPNFKDFTGQTFHGWEVISLAAVGNGSPSEWNCRHTCGYERTLRADQFRRGSKKYCTCEGRADYHGRENDRKVAETVERQVSRLRHMNGNGQNLAAPPSGVEQDKKRFQKVSAWELGRRQAEFYAKAHQCSGFGW